MIYFLFGLNIVVLSLGQILFKKAAMYNTLHELHIIEAFYRNPWFIGAIISYFFSTIIWIKVLTTFDVSTAYPVLSITYIVVALSAYFFFDEKLYATTFLGILFIMLGVIFLFVRK